MQFASDDLKTRHLWESVGNLCLGGHYVLNKTMPKRNEHKYV